MALSNKKLLKKALLNLEEIRVKHPKLETSILNELDTIIRQIKFCIKSDTLMSSELNIQILVIIGRFVELIPFIHHFIQRL